MSVSRNRRGVYRRYADRRVAALLELHEILFYEEDAAVRNRRLMSAMCEDYGVDRACFAVHNSVGVTALPLELVCHCGGAVDGGLSGRGIERIVRIHGDYQGALTLSRFRRSSLFESEEWADLWNGAFNEAVSAILSAPVCSDDGRCGYLFLLLTSGSREWNSHDRDLIEEQAHLFSRMMSRGMMAD